MDGFYWDQRIKDAESCRCERCSEGKAEGASDDGQQELGRHRESRRQTDDPAFQRGSDNVAFQKCTARNRSTVSNPFIGLMATANNTAGTTDGMGPMFGMKVSRAAIMPSIPASGTPSNPTPISKRVVGE
jgi:hypothetical protein